MFHNYKLFNKIEKGDTNKPDRKFAEYPNFNDDLYAVVNVFRNVAKIRILQKYDGFDFTMHDMDYIKLKIQGK